MYEDDIEAVLLDERRIQEKVAAAEGAGTVPEPPTGATAPVAAPEPVAAEQQQARPDARGKRQEREVPRPTVIVESCLRLGYMGIRSACVDIDFVDILVNLRRYGHRVDEIDRILGKYLVELLQVQGLDGGFCDTYVTPSNCYGYVTPARLSLTWTTWFRLATIGMVVCALWPQDRDKWVFRDTVGMGYLNARYAFGGPTSMSKASGALNREGLRGAWLATVRRTRFFRQHVTWQVRQRMSGAAG